MASFRQIALISAALLALSACGDDDPTTPPTGSDSGADTGDGGVDVGSDADATEDVGPDGTEDTAPDTTPDTTPDTSCDDADEDGVCDDEDVCPEGDDTVDTDEDGVPDACDICADGDDGEDADEDGIPDACDVCADGDDGEDADEDGVPDACDVCADADDTLDDDGDGVPNGCDVCEGFPDGDDTDDDGVPNGCDICDGDEESDADGDGVPDACDVCADADDTVDADGDLIPDGCDVCEGGDDTADGDADGVPDDCDNCPEDENPLQTDGDGDWEAAAGVVDFAWRTLDESTALDLSDDDTEVVSLGFEWDFFGLAVNEVYVSSNGFLSVDTDRADDEDSSGCCTGGELGGEEGGAPGVIAGFWDDLDPSSGGSIRYATSGDVGAREFVVEFDEVPHCCGDTPTVSFQVVLREAGGVEVHCESCGPHEEVDVATQGVESWRDGVAATLEGRNAAEWTAEEDGAEFTWSSTGGDGVGDVCDACPLDDPDDTDEDLVCDSDDVCEGFDDGADSDGDGVPDGCDVCADGDDGADSDGDGVPDACDACPADFFDDSDGDGICDSDDVCDGGDDMVDTDGDGTADFCDACPSDNPDDTDDDGVCDIDDACEGGDDGVDTDGDGVADFCDICEGGDDATDTDGDGVPDFCDACEGSDDAADEDSDGVPDACDNCALEPNADQADTDYASDIAVVPFTWRSGEFTELPLRDDEFSADIELGFTFPFYGTDHTTASVNSNGWLDLTGRGTGTGIVRSLPNAVTDHGIFGFAEDLHPGRDDGGTVSYATLGEAGAREFVLQFDDVGHLAPSAARVSFQVVLHEGGDVELHCLDCTPNSLNHVQGLQAAIDGEFYVFAYDGRESFNEVLTVDGLRFVQVMPDGIGDACDPCQAGDNASDFDGDGVPDACDLCPSVSDPDQEDTDIATAESIPFAPRPLPATPVDVGDDTTDGPFEIGFEFEYFGEVYTQFSLGSNGYIVLGDANASGIERELPFNGTDEPNAVIAGYAEDLDAGDGIGLVSYGTTGDEGTRELVVDYTDVPHWVSGGSGPQVTFQIVLLEEDNSIEVHCTNCVSDGGRHAQGIENPAGTVVAFLEGRNNQNFSLVEDGVRFTTSPGDGQGEACIVAESVVDGPSIGASDLTEVTIGNVYEATTSGVLESFEPWFATPTGCDVGFYVYSADAVDGPWALEYEALGTVPAGDSGFFPSGTANVAIVAGRFYAVAGAWGVGCEGSNNWIDTAAETGLGTFVGYAFNVGIGPVEIEVVPGFPYRQRLHFIEALPGVPD